MVPEEIKLKIEELSRGVAALRKSLNGLRSLVVKHYADVHELLRLYERRINRLEDKLGISHAIKPERKPKALKDPP